METTRFVRTTVAAAGLLALVVVTGGCSDPSEPARPAAPVTPPDLSKAGDIRIRVTYDGVVPALKEINMSGTPACAAAHPGGVRDGSLVVTDGGVANAFVYIEDGLGELRFPIPPEPVIIDQTGCLYEPRVAGAMVSQEVQFVNSDPEPHNVRGRPEIVKAWNFMISRQNSSRTLRFAEPEIGIRIGCDIHPWMVSYLSILDHPYFTVTPRDGRAALSRVPPGEYVVAMWHERLGTQRQTVRVEPLGSTEIGFTYRELSE